MMTIDERILSLWTREILGTLTGAELLELADSGRPCTCQGSDPIWHKHYHDPPFGCARCGPTNCAAYTPAFDKYIVLDLIAQLRKARKEAIA